MCLFISVFWVVPRARADELGEFQTAKIAFEEQRYGVAVDLFMRFLKPTLIGSGSKAVRSRPLMLEAYKYLGASHVFLNQVSQAEEAFTKLVHEDPDYVLDPVAFPSDVVDVFNRIKKRLAAAPHADALAPREQALKSIVALAETETIREKHSRWVAAIPFGVGQFQNGNKTLGIVLLASESVLFAVSLFSFLKHQSLYQETVTSDNLTTLNNEEALWRRMNWISSGLFAATAIGGVIEAQVNFEPETVRYEKRPLPRQWMQNVSSRIQPGVQALRFVPDISTTQAKFVLTGSF